MDIVHDCVPCIILTVGIVRIMQNCFAQYYYDPGKLDFVFSKIGYNINALLKGPVVQVDSA